ncbi:MAG: hypothetical protein COV75_01015 [Candidatus Omnitrophica bacterium CG11_big_fil_rev_8_21_14_0_20_63_9]|nr:MAG: hypothetical protein COV75_01015 [Candidatus Omnitrophica bacterium CG11_big_fil_rev_8_21_14_0_20_63_9]
MTTVFSDPLNMTRLRISKVVLFLGLYAVVLIVPTTLVLFGSEWLQRNFAAFWWFFPLILFAVLTIAAPILYLGILRRLEGRFMKDQRRYHKTLITASSGMTRIKEIQRLCRLIVHMVNKTVGLTNASLFLFEPKDQRYVLKATRHRSHAQTGMAIEQTDPLVELLRADKDLLVVEELQAEMDVKRADDRAKKAAWVASWMGKQEAKLILPSFSNDQLLAFLVLGAKRSGEPYTTDDIALFSGLANQAALAIENAMFFEELRTNEAYMVQSEKLASLGQLASGMAHEIHNPLTIISGEAQLYLERFKGQSDEADHVLKSIIEECQRAADITRRILRFAKPAPSELVAVDLKLIMEETLTLAGYQVRMEKVERKVDISPALPKVRGNHNQLQEVFLNLVLNACQAMGQEGGKLMISAVPEDSGVVLRVADTGPGIPLHIQRKVFDPFYTTKPTGTGLGLFVSQRIIKAHGGTIELASEEGKGTCFTIRLPNWQETVGVAANGAPAASEAPPVGNGRSP